MIQEKLQEYFTKEEQEELKRLLNKFCDCLDEQTEILKKKERKNQMLKLFRYLKKAYVPVIAIVLLLILQASCDLTLPTFTSNIVNVGIQQKGIEDAVPDVMREETFLALKSLMKQDDADDMEDAYKLYTKDQVKDSKYKDYKDGRLYVRRYISKKTENILIRVCQRQCLSCQRRWQNRFRPILRQQL